MCVGERELEHPEQLRGHAGEHRRLVLREVGAACDERTVLVGHESRVVPGREAFGAERVCRLRQQRDAEVAVAGRARVGRAPGLVVVEERLHDDLAEAVARVERDVRHPERVAGCPRAPHGLGRAAGARSVGCVGIDPEAQRDADGGIAAIDDALQGDGRVDASRHRNRGAGSRRGCSKRVERVRDRLRQRVERDGGALVALVGISRSADAASEAQGGRVEQ